MHALHIHMAYGGGGHNDDECHSRHHHGGSTLTVVHREGRARGAWAGDASRVARAGGEVERSRVRARRGRWGRRRCEWRRRRRRRRRSGGMDGCAVQVVSARASLG